MADILYRAIPNYLQIGDPTGYIKGVGIVRINFQVPCPSDRKSTFFDERRIEWRYLIGGGYKELNRTTWLSIPIYKIYSLLDAFSPPANLEPLMQINIFEFTNKFIEVI